MCETLQAKECKRCFVSKPLEEFHRQPSGPMGRHSWCKACVNPYARETRRRLKRPAEIRRWTNVRTKYGLTKAEFDTLLTAQSGQCAICQKHLAKPYIDHCHETGKVRGLLCHRCNIRLTGLEDRQFREKAMAYLSSTEASHVSLTPSQESA